MMKSEGPQSLEEHHRKRNTRKIDKKDREDR